MHALFVELQRYVGFTDEDGRILRALHPLVSSSFTALSEAFYERALEHADARATLNRGEKHVGQLKGTLVKWMHELFLGPWDERYVERRERIGRVHVQIALPQHFMVTAMNLVRHEFRARVNEHARAGTLGEIPEYAAVTAIERICDIDLALMLDTYRKDLEDSQARIERLSVFGQLVGSIGHELRNPLGVIETSLYVIRQRQPLEERLLKHLDRIGDQVRVANDIITQLMNLIRDEPLHRVSIDLSVLVNEALSRLPDTTIQIHAEEPVSIRGDPTQLTQVLVNLIQNASQFAGAQGRVEIDISKDERWAVLTVDDNGPGIDPSIRNRLFEPLVSSRPGGVGLGLALVRRVVERHRGAVAASRSPLGGARFTVQLPL